MDGGEVVSRSRVEIEKLTRTERELSLLFARLSEVYAERSTIMSKLVDTNMATGRKHPAPHIAALPLVSTATDEQNADAALRARGSRRRA